MLAYTAMIESMSKDYPTSVLFQNMSIHIRMLEILEKSFPERRFMEDKNDSLALAPLDNKTVHEIAGVDPGNKTNLQTFSRLSLLMASQIFYLTTSHAPFFIPSIPFLVGLGISIAALWVISIAIGPITSVIIDNSYACFEKSRQRQGIADKDGKWLKLTQVQKRLE